MPKTVLDLGCGLRFPEAVESAMPGYEPIGLDVRTDSLANVIADGHELPFRDESFDAVWSWHMLEHVDRDEQVLREVHRVLKEGGSFSCTVPNSLCHRLVLTRPIGRILTKAFGINFRFLLIRYKSLVHTDETHVREYLPHEITGLIKRNGFNVLALRMYGILLPFHSFVPFGLRFTLYRLLDNKRAGRFSHNITVEAEKPLRHL